MKVRAFITHKIAESYNDCQDRFNINIDTKSMAISDGMSQSIFPKIWAEILVNEYTTNTNWHPHKSDNQTAVANLCKKWRQEVNNIVDKMPAKSSIRYRCERSLVGNISAGATLAGIRFKGSKWQGDILGDSCLLVVSNNKIQHFLTSQEGDMFDNYPDYYDSNPQKKGKGQTIAISGDFTEEQILLIMSDPFSDFLKGHHLKGDEDSYIAELLQINTHEEFEKLVTKWRKEFGMHNDDSTLLIVEPDNSDDLNISYCDNINLMIEAEKGVASPKASSKETNAQNRNSITSVIHANETINFTNGTIKIEEYEKLQNENNDLKKRLEDLQNENNDLKKRLEDLQKENSQLSNKKKGVHLKKIFSFSDKQLKKTLKKN